jgi:hypothetical protein
VKGSFRVIFWIIFGSGLILPFLPLSLSLFLGEADGSLYFTGRDELFDLLDKHFPTEKQDESSKMHRVALTQTQALTGLGGIGKTQLAVEYAYRMHELDVYTHTFWINAASNAGS